MIAVQSHRDALEERMAVARLLIEETHPPAGGGGLPAGPISREARGLVILLLFASYEHLLTGLTRDLLEVAQRLRVSNRRLQPGLRAIALATSAKSVRDLSHKKMFSHGLPQLVRAADPGGRTCTIDTSIFPDDGSFFRRSQVSLWCSLFGVPDPHLILFRTWDSIDSIVTERNGIAHGRLTPLEVGRNYSEPEIRQLIDDWCSDWLDFLQDVGTRAMSRDFFRIP
jgi:hypothetical protein